MGLVAAPDPPWLSLLRLRGTAWPRMGRWYSRLGVQPEKRPGEGQEHALAGINPAHYSRDRFYSILYNRPEYDTDRCWKLATGPAMHPLMLLRNYTA